MKGRELGKIGVGLVLAGSALLGLGYGDVIDVSKQQSVVKASSQEIENPNTGVLYDIRQRNIENFVYRADEEGDRWQVSDIGGVKFEGDCEDFSLSVARDIYDYNQENGDGFSMGVIVTRSRFLNKFKAHAGLIVYDRQNGKYFLIDNGAYRFENQRGFIDLGEGDRAPYEDFSELKVNGRPVYDAYMMGLTGDPRTIDLGRYSKGMYWNQIF